jgi:hypothetical protein
MKLKNRIIGECYGISRQHVNAYKGNSYYYAMKFENGSRVASANLILTWN